LNGDKMKKISTNENNIISEYPNISNIDYEKKNLPIKRNYKKNPLCSMLNVFNIRRLLIINITEIQNKNKIIKLLNNNNINFLKADFIEESIENNIFCLGLIPHELKKRFLEIQFDDFISMDRAYSILNNLIIDKIKLKVLFL